MAASQATFVFPLISLPAGYHLLVASPQGRTADEEELMLFILPPQKNSCIILPQKGSIKPILSHTSALHHFHRTFDKKTANEHRTAPLRQKMLQSLLHFSHRHETPQEVIFRITRLSRTATIYLLNIKAFEAEYIQISINETATQCSIESLHHGAQLLHDQMLKTNVAIYELLDHLADNETAMLHWSINHLKMLHGMEQTVHMQFLHILQEAKNKPAQSPLLKLIINQLSHYLASKGTALPDKERHFAIRGFLPSFDPQQKMLSPELQDRIHGAPLSDHHAAALDNFCFKLKVHFGDQL